jgi:hypothetical protein
MSLHNFKIGDKVVFVGTHCSKEEYERDYDIIVGQTYVISKLGPIQNEFPFAINVNGDDEGVHLDEIKRYFDVLISDPYEIIS